ncbi:MAG: glycoside hydrolase family 32 protein, partial [Bacteroidales bacterium]|nr:glycoside hydrolase family 32 protein [Bacteroidales bacterium]
MKRLSAAAILLLATISANADVSFRIRSHYLNFPISHKVDRGRVNMTVDGKPFCSSVMRLADGEADYWTFVDVSLLKGKTMTLSGDFSDEVLGRIVQSDERVDEESYYKEALRPQYHFTASRGWINDPNGLIWHNGRYHMFFQHNPFEREWENMHWGHAYSEDLIHWTELPLALHPDHIGTMFSGTATMDYLNEAGFNEIESRSTRKSRGSRTSDVSASPDPAGKPAMLAFYTADKEWETQCMAYSHDEGLTWTKYEGNPIINSHERWQSRDTRDPKVFRYDKGGHWVMVLNERDGHTIYNSTDLRNWTAMSHQTGFWECPELFEIGEDADPSARHWVMWGASGTYMIGDFDGKTFTPSGGKRCNYNGSAYACQTFANMPEEDGRVIKIAWGRIGFGDSPFNGVMLLPQEQKLVMTPDGLRLASYPVAETENLFEKVASATDLTQAEANELLK